MLFYPITYDKPLFRPPSEANSLILQITKGCSWNKCSFCEMYTSKQFELKPLDIVKDEIKKIAGTSFKFNKVFLADGDAMVLSTEKLLNILKEINSAFNSVRRISSYAKPKDLAAKSIEELKKLRENGLSFVYVGIESGDNDVLTLINKGETFASTVKGLTNAKEAGIKLSVMVLNGLGGKELSEKHAINSAKLMNEVQPDYVSTLVLSFPFGKEHFLNRVGSDFTFLSKLELLREMKIFLEHTELNQSVFRSDHASNYLVLKGILSRDKAALCSKIEDVLKYPFNAGLREDWQRGL